MVMKNAMTSPTEIFSVPCVNVRSENPARDRRSRRQDAEEVQRGDEPGGGGEESQDHMGASFQKDPVGLHQSEPVEWPHAQQEGPDALQQAPGRDQQEREVGAVQGP